MEAKMENWVTPLGPWDTRSPKSSQLLLCANLVFNSGAIYIIKAQHQQTCYLITRPSFTKCSLKMLISEACWISFSAGICWDSYNSRENEHLYFKGLLHSHEAQIIICVYVSMFTRTNSLDSLGRHVYSPSQCSWFVLGTLTYIRQQRVLNFVVQTSA